jgi:hypothetical protein
MAKLGLVQAGADTERGSVSDAREEHHREVGGNQRHDSVEAGGNKRVK